MMAVGGMNKWTPSPNAAGMPRVSTRFSLDVVNKQADAGRDGQICLKTKSSGVNEERENIIFHVQLTTSWLLVTLTRLIQTLLSVITIQ